MTDPRIFSISRSMTRVALEERWGIAVERSIQARVAELQSKGLGRSGAAVEAVTEVCAAEARSAVYRAWQNIWQAATNVGIAPSVEVGPEVKAAVREQTAEHFERLRVMLQTQVQRHGPGGEGGALAALMTARGLALAGVDAQVDLALASAERRVSKEGVVYNFYGSVGAVASGANAVASAVQNIGEQAKVDLSATLERLEEAIARAADIRDGEKGDLVELVRGIQDELGRPKVNGWKLTSLFQGLGGAVQTISSVGPAYEAVKTFARQFGIELP